jgi:hypothetical protein
MFLQAKYLNRYDKITMKMIIFEVLILNVLVYIKERFKNKR